MRVYADNSVDSAGQFILVHSEVIIEGSRVGGISRTTYFCSAESGDCPIMIRDV